jgi:hypothetical protein
MEASTTNVESITSARNYKEEIQTELHTVEIGEEELQGISGGGGSGIEGSGSVLSE